MRLGTSMSNGSCTTISGVPGATAISRLAGTPRLRSPHAVLATTTASTTSVPASNTRTSRLPASLLPGWCRGTNRRVLPAPNAISRGARAEGGESERSRQVGGQRIGLVLLGGRRRLGQRRRLDPDLAGKSPPRRPASSARRRPPPARRCARRPSARRLASAVMSIFTPRARAWRAAVSVSQALCAAAIPAPSVANPRPRRGAPHQGRYALTDRHGPLELRPKRRSASAIQHIPTAQPMGYPLQPKWAGRWHAACSHPHDAS